MTTIDPMTAITMVVIGGGIMVMGAVRIIVDWRSDRQRRRQDRVRLDIVRAAVAVAVQRGSCTCGDDRHVHEERPTWPSDDA